MAEVFTRGRIEDVIRELAASDPKYRESLLADPKDVIQRHTGQKLDGEVKVIEETANVIYLTIPPKSPEAGDELSDELLEKVAGGFLDKKCDIKGKLNFGTELTFKASIF